MRAAGGEAYDRITPTLMNTLPIASAQHIVLNDFFAFALGGPVGAVCDTLEILDLGERPNGFPHNVA